MFVLSKHKQLIVPVVSHVNDLFAVVEIIQVSFFFTNGH